MRTGRRTVTAVLAGLLTVTGMAVVPGVAAAEKPAIDWQPCPDAGGVDCATIEVPLDWATPGGATIHIGLARREARDPANRIGAILMDPGGPGGTGVGSVKRSALFPDEVTERFDVVGFDPRGINTSSQLLCDDELSRQLQAARRPTSQREFDQLAALNKRLGANCRELSGPLVDHVDNLHTVEDMDAIREALGEEKLNYVGYSYGSLMGQQYAERHPDRIRAFVLDGNMDHSLDTAWEFMRTETEPVEQNFLEFADWCDSTAECALYGRDTKAVYGELREKAKRGELVHPETGEPIDFYQLSGIAFAVNLPRRWTDLAATLKAFHDGNGTVTATLADAAEAINNPYPAIWCSDWKYPVVNYLHYKVLRVALAVKFPNIQWSPYVDHAMTCVGSTVENTNPQRPLDIDGAPPLVMIGNVHDPATVYRWNQIAAKQSGANLITYEGWGHTIYGLDRPSECVNTAVNAYLLDLTVPEDGMRCPATEQPGAGSEMSPLSRGPYHPR